MQTTGRFERAMRAAGVTVGLGVVLLALVGWRLPSVRPDLAAEVAFSAAATGELEVEPVGVFLHAKGLVPGGAPQLGRLAVRNQTGKTLAVSLRALPDARDLDPLVRVELTSGGATVFSGTLGGLRAWTKPLVLGSGQRAALRLRIALPSTVRSGYSARIESIPVEFRPRAAEG